LEVVGSGDVGGGGGGTTEMQRRLVRDREWRRRPGGWDGGDEGEERESQEWEKETHLTQNEDGVRELLELQLCQCFTHFGEGVG
jgi:hypothetical protein